MKQYENVTIFDHPLIHHKVAILRDEKTSMKEFRELVEEITTLMTFEALRTGVPTEERQVKTPLEVCTQTVVKDNAIVIVPILRAGLGMVNGIHTLFPSARVGQPRVGQSIFRNRSGLRYANREQKYNSQCMAYFCCASHLVRHFCRQKPLVWQLRSRCIIYWTQFPR